MQKWIKKYKSLPVQVRASFWFFVCSFLQKGVSVITTPIFTRLLSTAEYGKFNVFVSWEGIFAAIVILTLPWGVFEQGLVKYSDERNTFTSTILGLMTTLTVSGFLIYFFFHSIINRIVSLNTTQMICMFSITWTSSIFSFWAMRERVDYKYKKLVLVTALVTIAKPAVGIILVLNSADKVTARIIGLAAVEMIFFLFMFISMMGDGRKYYSASTWKYALAFNIPLIPHYLSQRLLNNADRIMIERMVSPDAAGMYSLAYSIALLMQMVNTAASDTLRPWIYKKIKSNSIEDIHHVAYPAMGLVAIVNLLLISVAPEVVRIFAPADYYDAVWVIPPVTMSVYFMFMYFFFATFEFYFERTKAMSAATMIGALVNVVLNYIFIKIFGYHAAGYTTLFCYILYALMHYYFMRKICKEELDNIKVYDMRIVVAISAGFMAIGFLISIFYDNVALRYTLIAIMITAIVCMRKRIIGYVRFVRGEK